MLLNKKSSVVSFGGILTALSVICLFCATAFPFSKLAFSFVASLITGIVLVAFGYKVALIHYVAVCVLSILFVPNKTISLFYVIVLGNYPFFKFLIDKMTLRYGKLIIKLLLFNIYIGVCYLIATYVLYINISENLPLLAIWIIMIFAFWLYDFIYMPFLKSAYSLINKR